MQKLRIWEELGTGVEAVEGAKGWVQHHLAESRARVSELVGVEGKRTVENTLLPFDRAQWHLRMAGSQSGVMFMVHPEAGVRDAAQELSQGISAEGTALSLNRDVYDALVAVDVSGEDAATKYYMDRVLLGYRLSGVDKDETTRERIRALADKMTELSMSFSRTVQDDVRKISVDDV
jgi:thimet oligopeptidase